MAIQAVIFDFGGVLYHLPDRSWIKRWKNILNLKDDTALLTMISSPQESELLMDILVGNVPEEEMWGRFATHFRIHPALVDRVRRAFMSKRRLNKDMGRFLGSLRSRYKTAILSNAGTEARRLFVDVYEFDQIVDEMIISAEERVAKPDRRIYEIAVERLGIQPDEAIFVDDLPENILSAQEFGMHAIHFQSNAQVIADVNHLLEKHG